MNQNEQNARARHKLERDRRICDRIKAVLLYDKGWTKEQIAEALLLSEGGISTHIAEYETSKKLKPNTSGSQEKLSLLQSKELEELCLRANLNSKQFIVRHRYLSEENDFGITLSNRAGLMENAEYKIDSLKKALKKPCYIPSYTFFLDYQGDVLMCPHDWSKKIILGNLNNEKILDIWFSAKSLKIRKMLNQSNRNFTPCNVCDVDGTLIGEKNSIHFN